MSRHWGCVCYFDLCIGGVAKTFFTLPLIPSRPFDELRIFDKGGEMIWIVPIEH